MGSEWSDLMKMSFVAEKMQECKEIRILNFLKIIWGVREQSKINLISLCCST